MRGALLVFALALGAGGACGGGRPLAGDAAVERPGAAAATGGAGIGSAGSGGAGQGETDAGGASDGLNPASLGDGRCLPGAFPRDGICRCQPDVPTACALACTDLQTDDANCGICGRACGATATCRDGVCGPIPTTLVPAPLACGGVHLAAEGDVLYWTDTAARKVFAMGEGDLQPTTLAEQLVSPTIIAVANGTPVWFDEGKKALEVRLGADLIGTPVVQSPPIQGIAVSPDAATIYYSASASVLSVPAKGGTPTMLLTDESDEPGALALEGTTLAFTSASSEHVHAVDLVPGHVADCDSHDPMTWASLAVDCLHTARGQGSLLPDAILLRGPAMIWANGLNVNVARIGSDASVIVYESLAQSFTGPVTALAATADTLYFADADGGISKVALTVGAPTVRLARGQKGARSLAVTTKHVFWTTDTCAINAAPL